MRIVDLKKRRELLLGQRKMLIMCDEIWWDIFDFDVDVDVLEKKVWILGKMVLMSLGMKREKEVKTAIAMAMREESNLGKAQSVVSSLSI